MLFIGLQFKQDVSFVGDLLHPKEKLHIWICGAIILQINKESFIWFGGTDNGGWFYLLQKNNGCWFCASSNHAWFIFRTGSLPLT